MMDSYPDVTRVEVLDADGRVFVKYYQPGEGVMLGIQDDGRTLKVFAGTAE